MYSPYDFWQYWRNTDDADVGRYLRLFTELPLDEIERLEFSALGGLRPGNRPNTAFSEYAGRGRRNIGSRLFAMT